MAAGWGQVGQLHRAVTGSEPVTDTTSMAPQPVEFDRDPMQNITL